MYLATQLQQRHADFINLCSSDKVSNIYAFGSSVTDHFDPQTSDIDVVVKVGIADPADKGEALLHFTSDINSFSEYSSESRTK